MHETLLLDDSNMVEHSHRDVGLGILFHRNLSCAVVLTRQSAGSGVIVWRLAHTRAQLPIDLIPTSARCGVGPIEYSVG